MTTDSTLYARHGARHYWLVDPEARTLEALELRDGQRVDVGTYDDEATVRVPPFEAVELPIGRLFLPRASEAQADDAGAADVRHE